MTVNLERICNPFARITFNNVDLGGVNQQSTWIRICEDFARITSDNVDPKFQLMVTWKGSAKTLQGLPLKMLHQGVAKMVNLERILKEFARIISDMLILGGMINGSAWKGSAKTLQGIPLTMLIWGVWKGSAKTLQ